MRLKKISCLSLQHSYLLRKIETRSLDLQTHIMVFLSFEWRFLDHWHNYLFCTGSHIWSIESSSHLDKPTPSICSAAHAVGAFERIARLFLHARIGKQQALEEALTSAGDARIWSTVGIGGALTGRPGGTAGCCSCTDAATASGLPTMGSPISLRMGNTLMCAGGFNAVTMSAWMWKLGRGMTAYRLFM